MANDAALALVRRQQSKVDEVRRLVAPGVISAVFQPVVRISDGVVAAYEGFARFPRMTLHGELTPDAVLALAGEVGLRDELEVACWEAIAAAGEPPYAAQLILNISPASLSHGGLLGVSSRLPERLVLELADPPALLGPARVREGLAPWRARGAQVCVDEGGAGHAALEQIVAIQPDFLRISRALVSGLESDANARARLRSLVSFARGAGATLIASGVETSGQLAVLRDAGVELAMGWLFGRAAEPWPQPARVELPPPAPEPAPAPAQEPAVVSVASTPPTPLPALAPSVAATASLVASGQALVDAALDDLASRGLEVAVFVEQGGVLRCRAVRGVWLAQDGRATTDGSLGEAFRSGSPVAVGENELLIPCHDGPSVSGVLRISAPAALMDDQRAAAELCARVVGPRLSQGEPPTPAQLLARRSRRLATVLDSPGVLREALAGVRDLSGLDTAAAVLADDSGRLRLAAGEGPLATQLAVLAAEEWQHCAAWLEGAASCVSTGAEGGGLPQSDRLRELGVRALAVVSLSAAGRNHGFLLAAGGTTAGLDPERVELLELLGSMVAASLEMTSAVNELRDRASLDPVTGLRRTDALDGVLAELAGAASPSVVAVFVSPAATEDTLRAARDVVQRCAPDGSALLRSPWGLLAAFGAEGSAHAETVAALIEARAAALAGGAEVSAAAAAVTPGEQAADVLERCEKLAGAQPTTS